MVPIHDIDAEMRLHYIVDDATLDESVDGDDEMVEHSTTNAVGQNEVSSKAQWKALVDRGANEGIAGNGSKVVTKTGHIDLCGLDAAAHEQTDRYLTMSARRRAHAAKHYLPPSQCQLEDLEFDFQPCTSEDFRPYSSHDSEASESSLANPEVSIYQVTAQPPIATTSMTRNGEQSSLLRNISFEDYDGQLNEDEEERGEIPNDDNRDFC